MIRIALGIEYDGSLFHGWQIQKHQENTIQQHIEKAVSIVANESVAVHISGRTDAGVHASEQVAHFDTKAIRRAKSWIFGINTNLPTGIAIKWVKQVDDGFHARFSATARRYRYIIYNMPSRSGLFRDFLSWQPHWLDIDLMQESAQYLIGKHNFTSYRSVACQNQEPVKRLDHIEVSRMGSFVIIDIQASGFLMHMVRNIAGVLMKVGLKERAPIWSKEVLEAQDRTQAAETAPPNGLYFVKVYYPEKFQLPNLSLGPDWLISEHKTDGDYEILRTILLDEAPFCD